MTIISKAWLLQYKLEMRIQIFLFRMGRRFIVGLFAMSLFVFVVAAFLYYWNEEGDLFYLFYCEGIPGYIHPVNLLFVSFSIFVLLFLTSPKTKH